MTAFKFVRTDFTAVSNLHWYLEIIWIIFLLDYENPHAIG